MAENRGLIITGATLLVLVLLIGAFSLGVYIGRYGISQDGLRYAPAQADPRVGRGSGRPEGLPQGDPDLIGVIRRGSREGIEIATQSGPKWIEIDEDTIVVDVSGSSLALTNLRPRDLIAVFGELSIDDGSSLQATHIVRLPPRQPAQP